MLTDQDRSKGGIDEVIRPADLLFFEESSGGEEFQVAGGGEAGDLEVALDELDLRVRMAEEVVDEILAVKFVARPDAMFVVHEGGFNLQDRADGIRRSFLHGGKEVDHPFLPGVLGADGLEESIIIRLGANDVPAEIEHGAVQQALTDEVKDIEDAARAPVSIVERMDALKLMVNESHLDEGIGVKISRVVHEALEIGHQ